MRESQVTAAFAKLLPSDIYSLKVSLRPGCKVGVADSWYSGPAKDLWVEWKHLPRSPRSLDAEKLLTPNQLKWLRDRETEGRDVAVFISTKAGIVVFDDMNDLQAGSERIKKLLLSRKELAHRVTQFLRGVNDHIAGVDPLT